MGVHVFQTHTDYTTDIFSFILPRRLKKKNISFSFHFCRFYPSTPKRDRSNWFAKSVTWPGLLPLQTKGLPAYNALLLSSSGARCLWGLWTEFSFSLLGELAETTHQSRSKSEIQPYQDFAYARLCWLQCLGVACGKLMSSFLRKGTFFFKKKGVFWHMKLFQETYYKNHLLYSVVVVCCSLVVLKSKYKSEVGECIRQNTSQVSLHLWILVWRTEQANNTWWSIISRWASGPEVSEELTTPDFYRRKKVNRILYGENC